MQGFFLRTTAISVSLLSVLSSNDFGFNYIDCNKLSSYNDCIMAVNDDVFDGSKCMPALGGDPCVSWETVQDNGVSVDYSANHNSLSSSKKSQIQKLKDVAIWGQYPYDAQESDTLLKDMKIVEVSSDGTKCLAGYDSHSNSIIVSFRGSSNIKNWLENFDFFKQDYTQHGCKDCQVHTGFYESYQGLSGDLLSHVDTLASKYPKAAMVVTGHSLGSAQSVFAALDIQAKGHKVNFYSYGCPRPGDYNFAKFFNSYVTTTNLRGVFKNDPVTTVPYHWMEFEHVGSEVHFLECSNYIAYPDFHDPYPSMQILAVDDHLTYECIGDSRLIDLLPKQESTFLQ